MKRRPRSSWTAQDVRNAWSLRARSIRNHAIGVSLQEPLPDVSLLDDIEFADLDCQATCG